MRLTIRELYNLSKEGNMAVLAKDGLPFGTLTSTTPDSNSDVYFFRHGDDEPLDFHKFFEICIPSCCYDDMVAGECEVMEIDGVKFVGIDIYNDDLKKLEFGS